MNITQQEAATLYRSMILPSMVYSAPVGTLSRPASDSINSSITQAILPKMGYCRSTPLEVVYGPRHLGGIGLLDMFTEQGTAKVQCLMQELRAQTSLGTLLQTQLQWAQAVAGLETPILEDTEIELPQLADEVWITTLREFLQESDLQLTIPSITPVALKRRHDRAIMEIARKKPKDITDTMVQRINMCRIHLRVETVADLCNAAGTHITREAMECESEAATNDDTLWPRQPRPGPTHRKEWRALLNRLCKDGSNELITHLGEWTTQPTQKQWEAYVDYDTMAVVVRQPNGKLDRATINYQTRNGWAIDVIDETATEAEAALMQPTELTWTRTDGLEIEDLSQHKYNPNTGGEPESWHEFVQQLPQWQRELIPPQVDNDLANLLATLQDDEAVMTIVSDGGCRDNMGSFGWVAATESGVAYQGKGRVRGGTMNSYRAEAGGMLAWQVFLPNVARFHRIEIRCAISSFCDNQALVNETQWSNDYAYIGDMLKPEFDLLIAIYKTRTELQQLAPKLQQPVHVKGHQERVTPYHLLTFEAKLNVAADILATEALTGVLVKDRELRPITNPHCHAYLRRDKAPLTREEVDTMKWAYHERNLLSYYSTRFTIPKETVNTINWAGFCAARRNLNLAERKYATKLTIGWLPTGSRMEKYGELVTECHNCGGRETVNHIVQCPCRHAEKRETALKLGAFLEKVKTTDEVRHAIVNGIDLWLKEKRVPLNLGKTYAAREAIREQNAIGWDKAMRGLLSTKWAAIQEHANDGIDRSPHALGDTWSGQLSGWLVRESRSYWDRRNNERQERSGPTEPTRSRLEVETEARVRKVYARVNEISAHDRVLFSVPLEARLTMPTKSLAVWVQSTTDIVNRLAARERARTASKHEDIRTLFRRARIRATFARILRRIKRRNQQEQDATIDRGGAGRGTRKQAADRHRQPNSHLLQAKVVTKRTRARKTAPARQQNVTPARPAPLQATRPRREQLKTATMPARSEQASRKGRGKPKGQRQQQQQQRHQQQPHQPPKQQQQQGQQPGQQKRKQSKARLPSAAVKQKKQKTSNQRPSRTISSSSTSAREESNSALATMRRWMGARQPKFEEGNGHADSGISQGPREGERKTRRQAGILEFFKR